MPPQQHHPGILLSYLMDKLILDHYYLKQIPGHNSLFDHIHLSPYRLRYTLHHHNHHLLMSKSVLCQSRYNPNHSLPLLKEPLSLYLINILPSNLAYMLSMVPHCLLKSFVHTLYYDHSRLSQYRLLHISHHHNQPDHIL